MSQRRVRLSQVFDKVDLHFSRFKLSSNSTLRDRSALLGNGDGYASGSTSGRATPFNNERFLQRTAEELESQNDEHLEGLTAKVKLLKDVSSGS